MQLWATSHGTLWRTHQPAVKASLCLFLLLNVTILEYQVFIKEFIVHVLSSGEGRPRAGDGAMEVVGIEVPERTKSAVHNNPADAE